MASKRTKKAAQESVQIEEIGIQDDKIAVPSFKYKKAGEAFKKTYAQRQLDIPDRSGDIVRIYLEEDGTITTQDRPDHELILAEFAIPHDEYEAKEVTRKGKKVTIMVKKPVDFSKLNVINFDIPDRS